MNDQQDHSDAVEIPVLEVQCDHCRAEGGFKECGEWDHCAFCHGAGYVPTPAGKRILALMRHNFAPMLEKVRS